MARNKAFKVRNNRFQFVCGDCSAKRYVAVPQNTRHRNVRCHKCGARLKCLLNRRDLERVAQSGKVTMLLPSGKELTADLFDISPAGLGCSVHPRDARSLALNLEVKFKCSWNSRLVDGNRYRIQSIRANRIGLLNLTRHRLG